MYTVNRSDKDVRQVYDRSVGGDSNTWTFDIIFLAIKTNVTQSQQILKILCYKKLDTKVHIQ